MDIGKLPIDEQWREEFVRFIETGEADKAFLDYMEGDENCKRAVNLAFESQAAAFEELGRVLNYGELAAWKPRSWKRAFWSNLKPALAFLLVGLSVGVPVKILLTRQERIDSFEAQLAQAKDETEALRRERDVLHTELRGLAVSLQRSGSFEDALALYEDALDASKAHDERLRETLSLLGEARDKRLHEVLTQLEERETEAKKLRRALDQRDVDLSNLQAEISALKDRAADQLSERNRLEAQLNRVNSERSALEESKAQLQARLRTLDELRKSQEALVTTLVAPPNFSAEGYSPPKVISRPKVEYPELAKRLGLQGTSIVRMYVSSKGYVEDAHIVRSDPAFAKAALELAEGTVFEPAKIKGEPLSAIYEGEFPFVIKHRTKKEDKPK